MIYPEANKQTKYTSILKQQPLRSYRAHDEIDTNQVHKNETKLGERETRVCDGKSSFGDLPPPNLSLEGRETAENRKLLLRRAEGEGGAVDGHQRRHHRQQEHRQGRERREKDHRHLEHAALPVGRGEAVPRR